MGHCLLSLPLLGLFPLLFLALGPWRIAIGQGSRLLCLLALLLFLALLERIHTQLQCRDPRVHLGFFAGLTFTRLKNGSDRAILERVLLDDDDEHLPLATPFFRTQTHNQPHGVISLLLQGFEGHGVGVILLELPHGRRSRSAASVKDPHTVLRKLGIIRRFAFINNATSGNTRAVAQVHAHALKGDIKDFPMGRIDVARDDT